MLKIEITCQERWWAAKELAEKHGDSSLDSCILNLLGWMNKYSQTRTIVIGGDFAKHSFTFSEIREDGSYGICGGIIFHGFPEKGYMTNGSVQLEPTYGWQIHT